MARARRWRSLTYSSKIIGSNVFFDPDRGELAGGAVEFVAVGAVAAGPFASGGLAFHAVDDAVDDGLPLELGEHTQHLYEHATDGGGGVDGFGGRAEADSGVVEQVEDVDQPAQRPRHPVDAVDEQDVALRRRSPPRPGVPFDSLHLCWPARPGHGRLSVDPTESATWSTHRTASPAPP